MSRGENKSTKQTQIVMLNYYQTQFIRLVKTFIDAEL